MRAVLDPNVLVAALLSRSGALAGIVSRWLPGEFELVVSATLLGELERALADPKVRRRVSEEEASAFDDVLRRGARLAPDPAAPRGRSSDPGETTSLRSPRGSMPSSSRASSTYSRSRASSRSKAPRTFVDALAKT